MIHMQEKLELLTQKQEIANNLLENKLMSRKWIYDNIFQFDDNEKADIFDGIVEDTKQKFRLESIETEGSDPAEGNTPNSDEEDMEMARRGEWGGDRRSGTGKKEFGNEYNADDLKDATKYERQRYGKREFKGKSPLATSKGGTIVAREGLMNSLKKKFGINVNQGILNEDSIIDE